MTMKAMSEETWAAARAFYREKLAAAFHYSRPFSQPRGRVGEAVADLPDFAAVLRESAPGSFDCARRIGELALIHLDGVPKLAAGQTGQAPQPGTWWRELLNYERGWFLQAATTAEGPPTNRPRRGVSAVCMTFSWDLPHLIAKLEAGEAIGDELRRPVTLLFARARDAQVRVVEVGVAVEKVFRATNGLRTQEQIAGVAGLGAEDSNKILEALAGIGAVMPAMSPPEMVRRIEAKERL